MYDLLILGAGPAGITAAVYAARKKMNFLLLTGDIGGQASLSGAVENYTGYQFITGPELVIKFEQHMKQFNIPVRENEEARSVEKSGAGFTLKTDRSTYEAKTLIIATGKRPRMLNVPGEVEFKNRGVTYCATCDGPLFADKDVAVIGGGNSAFDAALQMISIANKVYILNVSATTNADAVMTEKVLASPKVEMLNSTKVVNITGDKFVSAMTVETAGKTRELQVRGVFVEIGLIPNSEFISMVEKNPLGEILIDCSSATSVEGIFAAGDVTNVPEKQIIIAAGDGAKATLAAFRYLATHQ